MTLRADNRLAEAPMTMVGCGRCAAHVMVRKSSWNQTSVQWDAAASESCVERDAAGQLAPAGRPELFLACTALSISISDAVRRGELPIVDEDATVSGR